MYDVVVIGAGPAGIAASISSSQEGAKVLLIEREAKLGGILKQCIHDGFGLIHFKERLTGPEYSERFIDRLLETNVELKLLTFVTRIENIEKGFRLSIVNRNGMSILESKTIVFATGCRERTAKQVCIHGTRPAGVLTAGLAQHLVNIEGQMPTKNCVILGSGDIGLIMARRLTLEGACVKGVYEIKSSPSGLTRNIHQCLNDFDIPLYLSHTVTRVFGYDRLSAVEVAQVDHKFQAIPNTAKIIECDSLILSVGLIPENELAESIGIELNPRTKGPICDQAYMTNIDGIYCCGNALHVNDLVDYVTENAIQAGKNSANYIAKTRKLIDINIGKELLYVVPSSIDIDSSLNNVIIYFRSTDVMKNTVLRVAIDNNIVLEKKYIALNPPEMERIQINLSKYKVDTNSKIEMILSEDSK